MAVYSELNYTQAVNDVKFHPLDHIVAFSSRGDNHKVLIFKYEYNLAEREAKNYFTLVPRSGGAATANDKYVYNMVCSSVIFHPVLCVTSSKNLM